MSAIRVLWLDRPEKRNALTLAAIDKLRVELEAADYESAVSGIVIAGRGPSFCAGVDMAEFARATEEDGFRLITELRDLCASARRATKVVACAIQGHCVGAAFELALACDFRVATPDTQFSMPEVSIGLPSVIDAALLERYVGIGRAHEMLLTADPMGAEEALVRGVVNRVVPSADLLAAAEELIGRVTRHDPAAIRAQKELFEEWLSMHFDEAVDSSTRYLARSFTTGTPQRLSAARLAQKKQT